MTTKSTIECAAMTHRGRRLHSIALLAAIVVLLCASCRATAPVAPVKRVLFVGNSLIYFGNAPAVYATIARENGHFGASDMIVEGGATLADRVADRSVERALAGGKYTTLILQERGGDLICLFGPQSCVDSPFAIESLAKTAKAHGVTVVMLGTYQPNPAASLKLVEKEADVARKAGIVYVEVSETMHRLRRAEPGLAWFAEDGMHPGKDFALLNALLVYRAVHGALPAPIPLKVSAPIYGMSSELAPVLRNASDAAPRTDTPGEAGYSADTMQKLLRVIESS